MTCPSCRLENPETAHRCDCGYEFVRLAERPPAGIATAASSGIATAGVQYLSSIDRSLRTIKTLMIAWAVFSVIAFIYLVVAGLLRFAATVGKP